MRNSRFTEAQTVKVPLETDKPVGTAPRSRSPLIALVVYVRLY